MGNSGSAHHLAAVPNSDQHNNYHHSPSQWSQSIPRDSTNRHTHQIKVLPELKGGARLRATNNGNILHGGGTLSGRKDLVLHNGVFRTRSTSSTRSPDMSEAECVTHPNRFMQRSQTQLQITRERSERNQLKENVPMKRFGSEPDLRGSGDEISDGQKVGSAADRNNFPKAKLIRNKKKKAAPLPPIQSTVNHASADKSKLNYDPSRFGWKKLDEKVPVINTEVFEKNEAPRKLRLFKTKAETRKVNELIVVPREHEKKTSSSDQHHSNRYSSSDNERQSFNSLPYFHERHQEFDRLSDHNDHREHNNRVLPPLPQRFRREKSFDLSLLMQQKEADAFINTSAMKQLNSKIPKDDIQRPTVPAARISTSNIYGVESKLRSRKFSQPVTSVKNTENDFKKELLAATRRRSRNIDLKTSNDITVSNEPMLNNQKDEEFQVSLRNILPDKFETKDIDIDLKEEDRRSSRNYQIEDSDVGQHEHQQLSESATRTFYFGMSKDNNLTLRNDELPMMNKFTSNLLAVPNQFSNSDSETTDSSLSSALIDHFPLHMVHSVDEHLNDPDSNPNGIQVHMRPTLPRRQFEVPRFSPAAAWRNLAQTDCDLATSPDETANVREQQNFSSYVTSDIDESLNQQQLLESRIERIYRDPVPGFPDNKSGDSGISGDAGLQEPAESPTVREVSNNDKIGPFLLPWTPLQDLGEESSSDDEANSKEELTKLVNRGHVFSLSLPRESHLHGLCGDSLQLADVKTFNSLQKLKRTVSSAFGSNDSRDNNKVPIYHNENWVLSRSAPNSIDNTLFSPIVNAQSDENDESIAYGEEDNENIMGMDQNFSNNECRSYNRRPRQQAQSEHSKILPPSFNYLTGGKHLMYLPNQDHAAGYDVRDHITSDGGSSDRRYDTEANVDQNLSPKYNTDIIDHRERESLQDPPEFALNGNQQTSCAEPTQYSFQVKNSGSNKSRNHHRFTFQSTVRQIERRRLAERLSKDAEQKEAQRLSELEAMRRVEEEFQKKRAREKASIRHQLRLYSLGEDFEKVTNGAETNYTAGQYTSLPIEWKSNGPRDEPDGAVSSPAASPTSQKFLSTRKSVEIDAYIDTKTPYISRLIEQKSGYRNSNSMKNGEIRTKPTEVLSEFHTTRREYIEYRNSRKMPVNTGLSGAQSLNNQQIVYKQSTDDQPSDNYRKSFAHGRSICSSDSDMSGPIVRSMGRRKYRSRSPSPEL